MTGDRSGRRRRTSTTARPRRRTLCGLPGLVGQMADFARNSLLTRLGSRVLEHPGESSEIPSRWRATRGESDMRNRLAVLFSVVVVIAAGIVVSAAPAHAIITGLSNPF